MLSFSERSVEDSNVTEQSQITPGLFCEVNKPAFSERDRIEMYITVNETTALNVYTRLDSSLL
jgi:hypothetical protein